jgi:hypothetical protein
LQEEKLKREELHRSVHDLQQQNNDEKLAELEGVVEQLLMDLKVCVCLFPHYLSIYSQLSSFYPIYHNLTHISSPRPLPQQATNNNLHTLTTDTAAQMVQVGVQVNEGKEERESIRANINVINDKVSNETCN